MLHAGHAAAAVLSAGPSSLSFCGVSRIDVPQRSPNRRRYGREVCVQFVGHPAMSGLFVSASAPTNYRDWKHTDYTFYNHLAPELHQHGILCEPDSREPWFVCEAHDDMCLSETLKKFEQAVDITLSKKSASDVRQQ